MEIRAMKPSDWSAVAEIYREGLATGMASFETEVPTWEHWDATHLSGCRLVAGSHDGSLLGWAALSPVSRRVVYSGVAEVSIYIGRHARGKGVGRQLMRELIISSEAEGIWTLQSGIFPQNRASIRLHEASGFRFMGKRERIAKRNRIWYDNLIYERRSPKVGLE